VNFNGRGMLKPVLAAIALTTTVICLLAGQNVPNTEKSSQGKAVAPRANVIVPKYFEAIPLVAAAREVCRKAIGSG
jgi:hypothetical protein